MQEHNRVINLSNEDWIHVNRFIQSTSPKGSSQDRIGEVDRIAGLEPVLVGSSLPACVLDRIVLPGVRVLRMLDHYSNLIGCMYTQTSLNIVIWLNPIRSGLTLYPQSFMAPVALLILPGRRDLIKGVFSCPLGG